MVVINIFFKKKNDTGTLLKISGIHCSACKILIGEILSEENVDIVKFSDDILELKNDSDFDKVKRLLEQENYKISRKRWNVLM